VGGWVGGWDAAPETAATVSIHFYPLLFGWAQIRLRQCSHTWSCVIVLPGVDDEADLARAAAGQHALQPRAAGLHGSTSLDNACTGPHILLQAKRTKAALPLLQGARRAVLLSGTPALSRPAELLTQLQALMPAARLTRREYEDRYCDMHPRFNKPVGGGRGLAAVAGVVHGVGRGTAAEGRG
jgi:hypothetical protein